MSQHPLIECIAWSVATLFCVVLAYVAVRLLLMSLDTENVGMAVFSFFVATVALLGATAFGGFAVATFLDTMDQ